MANGQNTKQLKESEPKVDTSDDSTRSKNLESMPLGASGNLLPLPTTATTPNGSARIWTNAALAELQSKAGLVAGALADFQAAGGIVVVKNIEYEPNKFSVKIYLVAEGVNVKAFKTADGLDFEVQPLGSNLVAEDK
ncbi:MAG: hypothetical protein L0287_10110 [Anaerolineae bacterium]|nr:hypothetical protein [Anaerolineae bacterium]